MGTRIACVMLIGALIGCDDSGGGGAGGAGGDMPDGGMGMGGMGGVQPFGGMGGEGGDGGSAGEGGAGGAMPVTCLDDTECADTEWCAPTGELQGACTPGCRPDAPELACGEREICNADRRCERDPRCLDDAECIDAETWCDDGACVPGCRPDPDNCLPDDEGRARRCNADTRACERLVACCDGDACTVAPTSACGAVVDGVFACTIPNLCERRCNRDSNCDDADYCDDRGLCTPGCREDDPESCPGQVCDLDTRACVPRPCERDSNCRPNQFCAPQGCLVGCRTDPDNCPDDTECGPNRQCIQSMGCRNDAQCVAELGEGFRCIDAACAFFCGADEQCGPGAYCEVDTGECVEGCRDDDLEDDDGRATATPVDLGAGPWQSPEDLIACPLDRDWFSFQLVAGAGVRVDLDFRHALGDLDLRLHPPEGPPILASTQNNDETIEAFSAVAGVWYVEVYARGLDTNTYTLDLTPILPGGCAPDAAEADGDDAPRGATLVDTSGLQDLVVFSDRTACVDDIDWFRVPMGNDDGMTIELAAGDNPMDLPLDFEIYGPGLPADGAAPTFLPNGGDARTLRFSAPRPSPQIDAGDYYIKVFSLGDMGGATYDLRVNVDRNRDLCLIDAAEPNDAADRVFDLMGRDDFVRPSFDGDVELRPDTDLDVEDLWLCAGDEDWFSVQAEAGDALTVSVIRNEVDIIGDTQVEIFAAGGQPVALGRNAAELNVARVDDLAAGRYRIRISAPAANTQSQYTLRIVRTAGPVMCPADAFEAIGNDARDDAAVVNPGILPGLTLCGGDADVDWYQVEVDTVSDLLVAAEFAHAQANLDIDVFRGDAAQAENANSPMGHSVDDNEEVQLPNRVAGTYFIRVQAVDGGDAQYGLRIAVEPREFACGDDPDEPNDAIGDATLLGRNPLVRANQWLCDRVPSEADVFRIDVPGGQGRTVVSSFVFGDDGDLVLDMLDEDGTVLASTLGVPREQAKQCIRVPSHVVDRRLYLRVRPLAINRILEDDERLDYDLHVLAGDDACDDVPPAAPGVMWPSVPPPQ